MSKTREIRYSEHHRIAKKHKNLGFKVQEKLNKVLITQKEHDNLHNYHGTTLPQERLQKFVRDCLPVCSNKVKMMMLEMIAMNREEFYNPKILKNEPKNSI